MFKYENRVAVCFIHISGDDRKIFQQKPLRPLLRPLQGIELQTRSISSWIYCVRVKAFFFLNNGNCYNYNHFRTPLLLLIRPNCMVQADAGSLLLERSHVMVSNTWHSSPCQRGPALAQASGQMPVMSSTVSCRTTDPQFLIKASRETSTCPTAGFPMGEQGSVWLWF